MNLIPKLSISYPNFVLRVFGSDRVWLMVSDAMILISHKNEHFQAYLPGSKDTVISKAVPSGRDFTIALRWSWSLRFPQMWGTREHNLWELGTAFALSPQSKRGFQHFHCLIWILQSSLETIISNKHQILAVGVINLSFPMFFYTLFWNIFFQTNKVTTKNHSIVDRKKSCYFESGCVQTVWPVRQATLHLIASRPFG